MSSRDQILNTIKKNLPLSIELPDHEGNWIQYDDPMEQFKTVLGSVGGVTHLISDTREVHSVLAEFISDEDKVVSCVPGAYDGRTDLSAVTDPHELSDVDFAILPGELMVAENGAIWVTDKEVPQRVLYFLTQHLAIVVPKASLVHNMHEAYERIRPSDREFGTFISGPSKTADIEQSLVKGAHGARTLHVFLLDEAAK